MALAQLSRCLISMCMCVHFSSWWIWWFHCYFTPYSFCAIISVCQWTSFVPFWFLYKCARAPRSLHFYSYAADCYFYSANYYLFSRICCTFSKWIKHKHLRKTINHVYAFYTANTVQWNRLHTHTRSHLWNSLFSEKFCIIISLDLKIIMFAKIRIQIHHLQFVNNKCSLSVCVANKHTVQL